MVDIKEFLTELPKCEHHLHLEGTLEPSLVFKLAKRNKIALPDFFPGSVESCLERYTNFKDLQDFLDHYYVGMSVLIHEQDFYELAMAYFERAHTDGCCHSEVFFDPQGHVERGIELDVVVNGLDRACKDATAKYGISNKLIMCLLRHLPTQAGMETVEAAAKWYEQGVIHGLGLDSSEKPFPPHLFEECYKTISTKFPEVGLTAHAGEEGPASYVVDAINKLGVTRIDHGVNSQHDADLMQRLAENRTLLSLCPLSNVKLQVVKHVGELPIAKFLEAGVPFSINSDDPAYFGGYILDNYLEVHKHFEFTLEQWRQIAMNGIEGSWCNDARKSELRNQVEIVYGKYCVSP